MSMNLFIWFICPPSQCYICLSLRLQVPHGDIAPHVPQGLLLLQLLNHWGEGVGDDESHQGQPPDQDYQGGQTLLEILVKIVTERKLKVNIILTNEHTFHPQPQQHPPASGMSSLTLLFSCPLSMSLLCALEFSSLFEDKIKLQNK